MDKNQTYKLKYIKFKENKVEAIKKKFRKTTGFTIVELLTVMSVIVILISLLVPSLNRVKRYAREVRQKNQFHSIDVAMELFNTEMEGYPESDALDPTGVTEYCGAMKFCEALMGQDLLGFHPDSQFYSDATDGSGNDIYATPTNAYDPTKDNLQARKGPYLQIENANAYRMKNIYDPIDVAAMGFDEEKFVLCDVYKRVTNNDTGKKIGMPILYYKADPSGTVHDEVDPDNPNNIYDYRDNHTLLELGMPWDATSLEHKLFADDPDLPGPNGEIFYVNTKNPKIDILSGRPYRVDSYILISAGFDGEYGTSDDIVNYGK